MANYTTEIYHENINDSTLANDNYRNVVYTVPNQMQLVLMSINPGDDIHREKHNGTQFIRVEQGKGNVQIEYNTGVKKTYKLVDNTAMIIPAGVYHKINNTGTQTMKLYTIYSPPQHESWVVEKYKSEH